MTMQLLPRPKLIWLIVNSLGEKLSDLGPKQVWTIGQNLADEIAKESIRYSCVELEEFVQPVEPIEQGTSEPIPLGCWSNVSLLEVVTGQAVSADYGQLDAAGELVFRLNASLPEGISLRFNTDTYPNPPLDAPAERAVQGMTKQQVKKLEDGLPALLKKQSEAMTEKLIKEVGKTIFERDSMLPPLLKELKGMPKTPSEKIVVEGITAEIERLTATIADQNEEIKLLQGHINCPDAYAVNPPLKMGPGEVNELPLVPVDHAIYLQRGDSRLYLERTEFILMLGALLRCNVRKRTASELYFRLARILK